MASCAQTCSLSVRIIEGPNPDRVTLVVGQRTGLSAWIAVDLGAVAARFRQLGGRSPVQELVTASCLGQRGVAMPTTPDRALVAEPPGYLTLVRASDGAPIEQVPVCRELIDALGVVEAAAFQRYSGGLGG